MKKLSIVGLGLMGGSLGLAAKLNGLADTVHAYARREETCRAALDSGMVDVATDSLDDAVAGADLVIFCVPVLTTPDLVQRCVDALPHGCVLTDVGSTKAEIVTAIDNILRGRPVSFVGSHPISGSHLTGIENSKKDLYRDAVVVVTPGEAGTENPAVDVVRWLWEQLGSRVITMDPDVHDRILAKTSHLPHLLAAALVECALADGDEEIASFCGSGFRDTTRVSMGSALLWHDIVRTNKKHVSSELASYRKILDKIAGMIEEDDSQALERFLAECRERRSRIDGD